jgi:hypothetical protein
MGRRERRRPARATSGIDVRNRPAERRAASGNEENRSTMEIGLPRLRFVLVERAEHCWASQPVPPNAVHYVVVVSGVSCFAS